MQIDLDGYIEGTKSFRFREALWAPEWGVHCFPTRAQLIQIVNIAQVLQTIRDRYAKPLVIHSWLRPPTYNSLIKGSKDSWHTKGGAVDFSIAGISCDDIREDLKDHLERWQIRMELLDGSDWVHIDNKPLVPGGNRFFKP